MTYNIIKNHNTVINKAQTMREAKRILKMNVANGRKRKIYAFSNITKSQDSAVCQTHDGKVIIYSILTA